MWSRRWKVAWGVLGLSVMLSGCLETEATMTVLEDGRIIDHVVMQPKISMLTLSALSALGANAAGLGSDTTAGRAGGDAGRLLQMLVKAGDVCKLADRLYDKEALATQGIAYSAVSVPTRFEFSEIAGSGCSIQIGPYDPRALPAEFAEKALGIRIESASGLHEPYRMSYIGMDEALTGVPSRGSIDAAALQAICAGELEPEPCQQELRVLLLLMGSWTEADVESDGFRDILSDPGVLGGAAEMFRMVLKSAPMTMRIPDDAAVSRVHGAWDGGYGQEWIWRGSLMDWITSGMNPGMSIEIRPTRLPTPSSH